MVVVSDITYRCEIPQKKLEFNNCNIANLAVIT